MLFPFWGRVRRRRLLVAVVLALVLVYFMRSPREHSSLPSSQFVPAAAPDDDMDAPQQHRPAKAPSPQSVTPPPPPPPPLPQQPSTEDDVAQQPPVMQSALPSTVPASTDDNEPEDAGLGTVEPKVSVAPEAGGKPKTTKAGSRRPPVDLSTLPMVPMEYGTTARPPVKGLVNAVKEQLVELTVDDSSEQAAAESADAHSAGRLRRRRLVFVGDVHGQRKPLDELLAKIDFDAGHDHLILTGDLVNKGPDSAGVVQLAMDLGASAVRGNHEDRVLLAYDALQAAEAHPPKPGSPRPFYETAAKDGQRASAMQAPAPAPAPATAAQIEAEGKKARAAALLQRESALKAENAAKGKGILAVFGLRKEQRSEENTIDHDSMVADLKIDPLEQNPFPHGDSPERSTAASLTDDQARWLAQLPVILHLGRIAPSPSAVSPAAQQANTDAPFNDVVVVHAGLVPDIPLEHQDPHAVMVMRSLVYPADEVRHERARAIAERKIRAEARGRIRPVDHVYVPSGRADAEFQRMQKMAYGPELHHPRKPAPQGSVRRSSPSGDRGGGSPEPANLVMLPIEGHFREGRDRVHWAAAWNQAQHAKPAPENRTTVIYGHDAITGLLVPEPPPSGLFFSLFGAGGGNGAKSGSVVTAADTGYTFGLDSGAVYGGKLSALVVEADKDGRVKHRIEQVDCPPAAKKKSAD